MITISFKFAGRAFGQRWTPEDLAKIDTEASKARFYALLAERIAHAVGADSWGLDWQENTGPTHKVYVERDKRPDDVLAREARYLLEAEEPEEREWIVRY